jgi:hypothetical protein
MFTYQTNTAGVPITYVYISDEPINEINETVTYSLESTTTTY